MLRESSAFALVLACALQAGCSSSSQGTTPGGDAGGSQADAGQNIPGAPDGSPSPDDASTPASPGASADSGIVTPDGDASNSPCNLSAASVLINPTLMYTSGTDSVDCPSVSNDNIVGSGCSLQPTGMCTAIATCTVSFSNGGSSAMITETGAVTVAGGTATGAVSYSDTSGITCNETVSGPVTVGTGTPGACMQTCENMTPNDEMGCNPCLMKSCAKEYAACLADTESGCINCSQLLSGNAGSGIQCTNTAQIVFNLLACGCSPATCD